MLIPDCIRWFSIASFLSSHFKINRVSFSPKHFSRASRANLPKTRFFRTCQILPPPTPPGKILYPPLVDNVYNHPVNRGQFDNNMSNKMTFPINRQGGGKEGSSRDTRFRLDHLFQVGKKKNCCYLFFKRTQ